MKQGGPRKASQESTALLQVGDGMPRSDGAVAVWVRVTRLARGLDQVRGVWDRSDDCHPLARGRP